MSTGQIAVEYTYDAWGNLISILDEFGNNITNDTTSIAYLNPIRYRGYYYDNETKLYFLQTRYYDPSIGRFISADGQLNGEFLGLNMYAYCENNPVNASDPMGTCSKGTCFWCKLKGVGASAVNGFCNFFVGQYNTVVNTASSLIKDPVGTVQDFYNGKINEFVDADAGTKVLIIAKMAFPIANVYVGLYDSIKSGIQTIMTGDVNAMAYRAGYNTAGATESVAIMGISYGGSKLFQSYQLNKFKPTQDWIDMNKVNNYANQMKSGTSFPSIDTVNVPGRGIYIIDGHHRYLASVMSGVPIGVRTTIGPGPVGFPNWGYVTPMG